MLECIRQQHKEKNICVSHHTMIHVPLETRNPIAVLSCSILPWIPQALRNIFRGIISDRSCGIKCIEWRQPMNLVKLARDRKHDRFPPNLGNPIISGKSRKPYLEMETLPKITGWWFQTCFMFTPILGEMIQFDEHTFQMGWFNHQPELYTVFIFPDARNGTGIFIYLHEWIKFMGSM